MKSRHWQIQVRNGGPSRSQLLLVAQLGLFLCTAPVSAQKKETWPPIKPEELVFPDPAADPSAPAMILDYEVVTDDSNFQETVYKRIKILREEGRKYADVEIPYYQNLGKIEDIRARTTSPDGRSAEFTGTIFDKEFIKTKKYSLAAKAFSLPDVQAGSIIEYMYRIRWKYGLPGYFVNPSGYKLEGTYSYAAAEWTVQQDLFVRHARFALIPSRVATHLTTYLHDIPREDFRRYQDGSIQLVLNNIPAFHSESHSGPEENLKTRADLFYTVGKTEPYEIFWESLAKRQAKDFDLFSGKSKTLEHEVAALTAPGDTEEEKLRKIYARVQQIRNLSFETAKSKKELKQESLKPNKSAEDVLSHGYGYYWEINYTFIALARAAGLQASPVSLATRDRALFTPQRFDSTQLTATIAEVRLGGVNRYFDPATIFCPFGFLPWPETAAKGIRLSLSEGAMVTTPEPESPEAVTHREAELKLDADGNLQGKLVVTMRGQQALAARIDGLELDNAGRQKYLEDYAQPFIPSGSTVKVLSTEGWRSADAHLKAEYEITSPGLASHAGSRLIVPMSIFHAVAQPWLAATSRVNPVYFDYSFEEDDDISIELPPGYTLQDLPGPQSMQREEGTYELKEEARGNTLHLHRSFKLSRYFFPAESYPALRTFYALVRTADEQLATLTSPPVPTVP